LRLSTAINFEPSKVFYHATIHRKLAQLTKDLICLYIFVSAATEDSYIVECQQ